MSLFIYVFYRTDKTLINYIISTLFSYERYTGLKNSVVSTLPLNDYIIYCLPGGLWVFCITITSSFFYVEVQDRRWSLVFIPLLVALVMELCQLANLTNGRFDVMDIVFSVGLWLLAVLLTNANPVKEPLFQSFNAKTICCMASYSIVYLSHVIH